MYHILAQRANRVYGALLQCSMHNWPQPAFISLCSPYLSCTQDKQFLQSRTSTRLRLNSSVWAPYASPCLSRSERSHSVSAHLGALSQTSHMQTCEDPQLHHKHANIATVPPWPPFSRAQNPQTWRMSRGSCHPAPISAITA